MNQNKLLKTIVDCDTGKIVEREYTEAEYSQHKLDIQEMQKRQVEAEAKATAKAAAQAKLAALGLTTEDLQALGL
jgi:hypothetical protein